MFFNTQVSPYQQSQNGSSVRQRIAYTYSWPEFSQVLQKWIGISAVIAVVLTMTATLVLHWQITTTMQQIEELQAVRIEKTTAHMALLAKRAKLSSKETIQEKAAEKFNLFPATTNQTRK